MLLVQARVVWLSLALSISSALALPLLPPIDGLAVVPLSLFWKGVFSLFTPYLVQTCADCQPYWTTEWGKHALVVRGIHFVDVTHEYTTQQIRRTAAPQTTTPLPKKVTYRDQLTHRVFKNISDAGPRSNLATFTAFRTRYYRSAEGRASQAWLKQQAELLAETRSELNISVSEWTHSWGQNSIILHIPGSARLTSDADADAEGLTIVGAHQDSAGLLPFLRAPGADDDGSGTVTLLEALRALLTSGWRPITDVEFHWYSAEEGGLLGSQEVVRGYVERSKTVKAMLQQDMTAFVKRGTEERVGLPTDFVDEELRQFVQTLVDAYLDIPAVDTKLGYAASDHASWNKAGYRSVFAIEAPFEDCNLQRIHTTRDTFDHDEFSFDHLVKFVRLTSAFVVELAGWDAAK